ncbi:MAG: hypothetical protein M3O95_02490 [Candidatus Dormibacteraeota bacterium]|nr:hypothetical protein [Candidatus Dormibacteraeota bacterium]
MASPRYRFPAFYGGDAFGSPTAWWVVGWDEELLSFTGRLEMDREGETPGEDFDPDEGPAALVGVTMGELAEPAELVDAMAEMEPDVQLPRGLDERLVVDRHQHMQALSAEQWEEIRERAAQGWTRPDSAV